MTDGRDHDSEFFANSSPPMRWQRLGWRLDCSPRRDRNELRRLNKILIVKSKLIDQIAWGQRSKPSSPRCRGLTKLER
ncbi:hypothetical protein EVAR_99121_1 [Eumeta japonica]|uniref:Uncharacterized protein n=1 Tax=Eumeta variegata TaxID=151549 RepID=A0A4C1YRK7_EUMVA|nr:hypothetical protein EVAR_99121_1 [Eumeta japonica]